MSLACDQVVRKKERQTDKVLQGVVSVVLEDGKTFWAATLVAGVFIRGGQVQIGAAEDPLTVAGAPEAGLLVWPPSLRPGVGCLGEDCGVVQCSLSEPDESSFGTQGELAGWAEYHREKPLKMLCSEREVLPDDWPVCDEVEVKVPGPDVPASFVCPGALRIPPDPRYAVKLGEAVTQEFDAGEMLIGVYIGDSTGDGCHDDWLVISFAATIQRAQLVMPPGPL